MFRIILLILLAGILGSCRPVKYEDDTAPAFTTPALANSPEYVIYLNGTLCRDVDGKIGHCAKRIKSNTDLRIKIPAQSYGFEARLDCVNSINSDTAEHVLPERDHEFVIDRNKFQDVDIFSCTVDILPDDREIPIAAFARFQIVVVDEDYSDMPAITRQGKYLVLGQYAYAARVFEKGKWNFYHKTTTIETTSNVACVESFKMRSACINLPAVIQ